MSDCAKCDIFRHYTVWRVKMKVGWYVLKLKTPSMLTKLRKCTSCRNTQKILQTCPHGSWGSYSAFSFTVMLRVHTGWWQSVQIIKKNRVCRVWIWTHQKRTMFEPAQNYCLTESSTEGILKRLISLFKHWKNQQIFEVNDVGTLRNFENVGTSACHCSGRENTLIMNEHDNGGCRKRRLGSRKC